MARVSIDNGTTYFDSAEGLYEHVEEHCRDDVGEYGAAFFLREWADVYGRLVNMMDDDIMEVVHFETAPCSEIEFLNRYLKLSVDDLVIG